jgi:hypothetical protein
LKSIPNNNEDNTLFRSCIGYIISYVAQDPAIHHLSARLRYDIKTILSSIESSLNSLFCFSSPQLLNFRARSIQQSAQVGSSSDYDPYSAAGLLGDGQIVTIADTGVDSFSCYFYDPQGQIAPSDVSNPKYDLRYRKIIQYNYNSCGKKIDAPGGHGTHVCGIIAGGISGTNLFSDGKYGGVAPNAKISVSSFGTPDTGLCIPPIFQVYGPGYNAGSRIHSNSWGAYFTGNGYYSDQDTDRVLFLNPVRAYFLFHLNNIFFRNSPFSFPLETQEIMETGQKQQPWNQHRKMSSQLVPVKHP